MEISIQKPCHENWDAMTPNEQGAFCGKCVKTVVDFSNKSIEEIKAFFIGKQNEKVCGRFEKTQLTSLSFDAFYNEFKGFHFTKRFAVIVYFTFGMWLFNTSAGVAQTQQPIKGDVQVDHNIMGGVRANPTHKDTTKTFVKPTTKTIKGKVKYVKAETNQASEIKMGEVVAEPVKKEFVKPQKFKSKRSVIK
jgi:hypothetical protein